MMNRFVFFSLLCTVIMLLANSCDKEDPSPTSSLPDNFSDYLYYIPPTSNRTGDAMEGKDYLFNGDYVESGIPIGLFGSTIGSMEESNNYLNRSGINENIPYGYTASTQVNGATIVSPNCFQCHAGKIGDEFIVGLGNSDYDFTTDMGAGAGFLDLVVKQAYGEPSPEWDAYFPFSRALKATQGQLVTEVVGANPADKLAAVLAAHRDPIDLSWQENPIITIPNEVVPADPPAWWLLKKKNAMFTTGVGRGDYARMMMASSLLTMPDSTRARVVDDRFADVLSFINSLEAPDFPLNVNEGLVAQGEDLFSENCASCHGTYGDNPNYPNFLVDLELVNTDALLATSNYAYDDFVNWYNSSWFNQGPYAAYLQPGNGYVAPPLDGVWATAPYFHNGSVPTLWDVLDSDNRPKYWMRSHDPEDFDYEKLGWQYTRPDSKLGKQTYDTTIPGYGNGGHDFGDHLNNSERQALIEYLKTI